MIINSQFTTKLMIEVGELLSKLICLLERQIDSFYKYLHSAGLKSKFDKKYA